MFMLGGGWRMEKEKSYMSPSISWSSDLNPFDFQLFMLTMIADCQFAVWNKTLPPSARRDHSFQPLNLFFFFINFLILPMWTARFFRISFLFTSPKYPVLSGNQKNFKENDKDLEDTFKSNDCCYPLFIKHRWGVQWRSVCQFVSLFTKLKHFLCCKHLANIHLCITVLTESSTDVEILNRSRELRKKKSK